MGKILLENGLNELELDDEFRAAYLFYLQTTNTYLASIFWHVFKEKPKKKQLYEFVRSYDEQLKSQARRAGKKEKGLDKTLLRSLLPLSDETADTPQTRSRFLECYNADFCQLLRNMPENLQASFKGKLSHEHAIPLTLEQFCDGVETLRSKRNYLKDWARKSKQPNRPDDADTLRMLGLLLPAKMHQHFCGCVAKAVRRHIRKIGYVRDQPAKIAQQIFSTARKDRALATKAQFGTKRNLADLSPAEQRAAKSERQAREHSKTAWMKKYQELYPEGVWPRNRYHNFKILYYFMGAPQLKRISNELEKITDRDGKTLPGGIHFDRDIVVAHMVGLQINNILDLAFWRLTEADKNWEQQLFDEGLSRKKAKEQVTNQGALSDDFRDIRNAIAHNGLFWSVRCAGDGTPYFLSVEQVFTQILMAFTKAHVELPQQQINDIFSKIESLLHKQKFDWVFPAQSFDADGNPTHTPPVVIRRWSKATREKYTDKAKWRIDRRAKIKALLGHWMGALQAAKKQVTQAEQKQIVEHKT